MRSVLTWMLLVALLAGCLAPVSQPPPSPNATPPSGRGGNSQAPELAGNPNVPDGSVVPDGPDTIAVVVSTDGRRPFDAAPARDLVASAWRISAAGIGAGMRGEAALAVSRQRVGAATEVVGLDDRALVRLGGLYREDGAPAAPPGPGGIVLTRNVSNALHARSGDVVVLTADLWPEPRPVYAFEMDGLAPCEDRPGIPACTLAAAEPGTTRLHVTVPPRALDLSFHPDVVELRADDFPAFWNGTFVAPGGRSVAFATAALSPESLLPPGRVSGDLEAGTWTVEFTLDVNGTRVPGAFAGQVAFHAPGYRPFDAEVWAVAGAENQTAAVLAQATEHRAQFTVQDIIADRGAPSRLQAGAFLALGDAQAVLGANPGEVNLLVAAAGREDVDAVRAAAVELHDARLRWLRARPAAAEPLPVPEGALVLRAPAALDPRTLPAVDGLGFPMPSFAVAPSVGARASLGDATLPPFWLLAIPARGTLPGVLLPGGHWSDKTAAIRGVGTAPNLVLASDDLVRGAGVDPRALDPASGTLVPFTFDGAVGPQTTFAVGALIQGPARTLWAGAPLLAAFGSPAGARIVATYVENADPQATFAAALESWGPYGVVPLVGP